jgi:hypothetical protein
MDLNMTGVPDILDHCVLYAIGEVYGVNPVVDRIVNNVTAQVYGVTDAIDEVLDGVDYDAPLKEPFTVEREFELIFGEIIDGIDFENGPEFFEPAEEEEKDDEEPPPDDGAEGKED